VDPVVTHYDVLGVSPSASADEVRAAYRAAARDHHPDAGGDPGHMRRLNAAWQVLGDPARRAAYDRRLAGGRARTAGEAGRAGGSGRSWGPAGAAAPGRPGDDGWVPAGDMDLTPEEWADLADGRPLGETLALAGWWAILPPATLLAAVGLMVGAFFFGAPVLLALSGGMFALALGLFVLAPLRAMTRRDRP
jgi:hypothetical protein